MIERRKVDSAAKLVGLLVGIFTLLGMLMGLSSVWGQHLRADADQDRRLTELEENVRVLQTVAVSEHPKYSSAIYPEDTK